MAGYGHAQTALNVCFQKCATDRVVSGVRWCSKSSIVASFCLSFCYSFSRFFIAHLSHFVNPIDFHCSLARNGQGGCLRLVVVFSHGSIPTVETENRAELSFNIHPICLNIIDSRRRSAHMSHYVLTPPPPPIQCAWGPLWLINIRVELVISAPFAVAKVTAWDYNTDWIYIFNEKRWIS